MTSATGPRAINCTSCGAGLNVLGGGRVTVQVCDFCGAALDATGNFEIVAQFSAAQDIGSPFVPGMTGTVDGIDWTVIGSLARSESWQGQTWSWFEHQLYSETHGYAWISVEDGHLVFSRRMRGRTDPRFITSAHVERAENRPTVRVMDDWIAYGTLDVPLSRRMFKYHESGEARTDQAAGAFTWLPSVGERDRTVTLVREQEALSFTETARGEREITLSRYLPQQETYDSFGVAPADIPARGIHILEPYLGWVHERFVKRIVGASALLCLLFGLYLLIAPATRLAATPDPVALNALPAEVTFEAPADGRLIQIRLESFPSNGWAGFEVDIEDPEGVAVGWHEIGIERYSGRDSDGSWTEGSSTGWVILRPAVAGPHIARVTYTGFEEWSGGRSAAPKSVSVEVRAKRGAARWPLIGAAFFGLLFVFANAGRFAHAARRANLSDWVDEEDDD